MVGGNRYVERIFRSQRVLGGGRKTRRLGAGGARGRARLSHGEESGEFGDTRRNADGQGQCLDAFQACGVEKVSFPEIVHYVLNFR